MLGKLPRFPGSVTDKAGDLGCLESRFDESGPFYERHRARAEARRAFIHLDTSRKVARALPRNAAPFPLDYKVCDLVVYCWDTVPGRPGVVWSIVSRVIGREADNALWLLNEGIPVLVSVHKLRPADEVEVAASRVLAGLPVLPEAIVNGPEQGTSTNGRLRRI